MLMNVAKTPEDKSNFKNAIIVLAFFQPDVGPTAAGLEQMGPQQQTWKKIVDREKRALEATLTQPGYVSESTPKPE
ncbi:MAG: hypothetical protein IPG06_02305 [Haliea sp.]|nr:hypothetical protein [Haliea sp.]